MHRFAYRIPCAPAEVADHPAAARVRRAWPKAGADEWSWMAHKHPSGGSLMVWPRRDGAAAVLEEFGEPRKTEDGLEYYPSKVAPLGEDLIRPERSRPPGDWLALQDGGSLYVSLALMTPKRILLRRSSVQHGSYATELGRLGFEIYELWLSKQLLRWEDERLPRVLSLILQAGYFVTEEMIEDGLPFALTDADVHPILLMMFGLDPKSSAAELAPLPSAQAPTQASP